MLFQRVNRTDPERVFVVMQANEANIAKDDVVQLELTAASVDGVKIAQPNTNELHAAVGVADAAIANGEYGLVQVYGYRSSSRIFQTSVSISLADLLVPVAGEDYLQAVASNTTWASSTDQQASTVLRQPVIAVACETIDTAGASATQSGKIFLKAMGA